MRLSEAIRLGAMLRPHGSNSDSMRWWVDHRPTCALGAALHAQGIAAISGDGYSEIKKAHSWIDTESALCPSCPQYIQSPMRVIYHLNDIHKWTRERIADWVATIEPQEVAEPVVEKIIEEEPVAP